MAEIGIDLEKAKDFLIKGALVAIPTETVYGLAGNGLNEDSILSIFNTKNRPSFDPLILHTFSIDEIKKYVVEIPVKIQILLDTFSPGPLTVLLPKNEKISDLITSGLPQVAFRIPKHDLTLELLKKLPFPLAAPSANPFGYISPTTSQHVDNQLGKSIPYILEGGDCNVGIESTIVGYEDNELVVYRLGGLSVDAIESAVGKVKLTTHSSSNPKAPGMLKSHYSPRKKTILYSGNKMKTNSSLLKVGYIGFRDFIKEIPKENQLLLSPNENMDEAARHLFTFLRKMDESDFEEIHISLVPNIGLGKAINDRIKRATI